VPDSRGLRVRRRRHGWGALALFGLVPLTMGGCPEFQNESVSAVETAVRGIVDAGVTLFFDQFRNGTAR